MIYKLWNKIVFLETVLIFLIVLFCPLILKDILLTYCITSSIVQVISFVQNIYCLSILSFPLLFSLMKKEATKIKAGLLDDPKCFATSTK